MDGTLCSYDDTRGLLASALQLAAFVALLAGWLLLGRVSPRVARALGVGGSALAAVAVALFGVDDLRIELAEPADLCRLLLDPWIAGTTYDLLTWASAVGLALVATAVCLTLRGSRPQAL